MLIPIIIVDYNSIKKTLEYVEQFSGCCDDSGNYRPIIVDNYEEEDSFEYLKKEYDLKEIKVEEISYKVFEFKTQTNECVYVKTGTNLGYAKGNNLGTIVADILFQPEFYIISNNDLVFNEKLEFKQFENIFEQQKDVAIVGPKIITPMGVAQSPRKETSAFYRLIIAPWISLWPFKKDPDLDYSNESKYCYFVMGCFMAVKASCFKEVGRFDENTFLYGEECILSERLKKHSYKVWFENSITVTHEHGVTINKNSKNKINNQWLFESLRYYYKEYKGASDFVLWLSRGNFKINEWAKRVVKKVVNK